MKNYYRDILRRSKQRSMYYMCQLYGHSPDSLSIPSQECIETALFTVPTEYREAVKDVITTQNTAVAVSIKYNLSASTIGRQMHNFYIELGKLTR